MTGLSSPNTMSALHTQGQPHDRINYDGGVRSDGRRGLAASGKADINASDISITAKMLSAVTGSIVTSLLITPLDVVRVRLQTQTSPSPSARLPSFLQLPPNLGVSACCREVFWVQNQSQFCVAAPATTSASAAVSHHAATAIDEAVASDCAAVETQRRTFNSTLDGLRKIARNEGMSTLWRGLSPTLLMAVPANVIYFAGYDWLRTSPKSPIYHRVSDAYAPLAAGSIARILAAVAVGPIEMLRTRMQATQTAEKGVLRATVLNLRDMVAEQGYTSLWRGLTLTLWRDVPFSALYWWGYEFGRHRLDEIRAQKTPGHSREQLSSSALLADSFLAGASAGAISAFVTTPFDVGKTRQQTVINSGMTPAQLLALPEGKTMPRFLWHIYCTEGMPGLFKGWAARCLKVAPACAIMISSYEFGKRVAGGANDRRDAEA